MKFSIKDFFSRCDHIRSFPTDLVTFPEEILHRKLHFLCIVCRKAGPKVNSLSRIAEHFDKYCVKYARTRDFFDPFIPV